MVQPVHPIRWAPWGAPGSVLDGAAQQARAGRQRTPPRAPHEERRRPKPSLRGRRESKKRRQSGALARLAEKSPCVGVVPEGDKDRAPARANPFMEDPSDATDSSSLETTFFAIEGDRFSLKASPSCHNTRSISCMKCCWGPMTEPGRQMRNHAIISAAVNLWCFMQ